MGDIPCLSSRPCSTSRHWVAVVSCANVKAIRCNDFIQWFRCLWRGVVAVVQPLCSVKPKLLGRRRSSPTTALSFTTTNDVDRVAITRSFYGCLHSQGPSNINGGLTYLWDLTSITVPARHVRLSHASLLTVTWTRTDIADVHSMSLSGTRCLTIFNHLLQLTPSNDI